MYTRKKPYHRYGDNSVFIIELYSSYQNDWVCFYVSAKTEKGALSRLKKKFPEKKLLLGTPTVMEGPVDWYTGYTIRHAFNTKQKDIFYGCGYDGIIDLNKEKYAE